jgi:hypothetical protein
MFKLKLVTNSTVFSNFSWLLHYFYILISPKKKSDLDL